MAYVPGVALLAALVVGCSSGSDGDAGDADSKPGSPTVSAAPPGKYRTLPEACRAVPPGTLRDLLPGTAELPQDQQEKVFQGAPSVTYDTDRKVGCTWKSQAPDGSRNLVIDFERVVSYDPAVSDDDRARDVYAQRENAADLPTAAAPHEDEKKDKEGEKKGKASVTPSGTATTPSAPATDASSGSGSDTDDLRPRVLDHLGDTAFLDDLLTQAGSTAQHRTVSVVFRTSNVIVTVQYTEQPSLVTEVPDSRELQEKAQALARKLAEGLSE
ncbi:MULTISPECIES: DUF3558 domain-containing protein [unclassified Streptomyces]|uniref:DUF3558 domain-containing protein n=1 Tax=unclassified Streptomyces TaxID=2593676 RepID=UPI002DD9E815|nr:DUF3558 domain-containing protein [Streptomyces sp. NBC_01237]WRZ73183.1 DUF3558 domain-containing protein [Streptomyces sp. NBC_01237]